MADKLRERLAPDDLDSLVENLTALIGHLTAPPGDNLVIAPQSAVDDGSQRRLPWSVSSSGAASLDAVVTEYARNGPRTAVVVPTGR
jgi:hypothetical protein